MACSADSVRKMNSNPRRYIRAQIVPFRRTGTSQELRYGQVITTLDRIRERSARPSASQKGIRKTPDVALLPNLAVYENQGAAAAWRCWPGVRPGSALGGRPGARRATSRRRADRDSSYGIQTDTSHSDFLPPIARFAATALRLTLQAITEIVRSLMAIWLQIRDGCLWMACRRQTTIFVAWERLVVLSCRARSAGMSFLLTLFALAMMVAHIGSSWLWGAVFLVAINIEPLRPSKAAGCGAAVTNVTAVADAAVGDGPAGNPGDPSRRTRHRTCHSLGG